MEFKDSKKNREIAYFPPQMAIWFFSDISLDFVWRLTSNNKYYN